MLTLDGNSVIVLDGGGGFDDDDDDDDDGGGGGGGGDNGERPVNLLCTLSTTGTTRRIDFETSLTPNVTRASRMTREDERLYKISA